MAYEWFISQRYLRVKYREAFVSLITFLSISGVAVGVMALIVVIAVMYGAEIDIRDRILGVQSHMVLISANGPINDPVAAENAFQRNRNVAATTPVVQSHAMIRSSHDATGVILRGIDPESAGRVTEMLRHVSARLSDIPSGGSDSIKGLAGIVLGKTLAKKLSVSEGDTVFLISPRSSSAPLDYLPAKKRFKIVGTFSSGMHEYDAAMAYIRLSTAQEITRMGASVSIIAARLHNVYDANKTAEALNAELGFPYWVRDWMQMNRNLFSALKLQKAVMFVILTLIILVAAFNIASSLIMMVMEKTREIAILKTMGATSRSVKKVFVIKGMVIGAVGTVIGVTFGWVLCTILKQYHFIELPEDVYYFTTLPVQLEATDVLLITSAALLLCFLSTLYPARQASRLNPVDAIRYG